MIARLTLASLAMLALTACADNTTARFSSDYATQLSRNELLILPANAEAVTVDATSTETRMYDYEDHIEPILADELQKKLQEKGYRAKILHKKDLMKGKTYREYDAFRAAFDNAYKEAYAKGPFIKREEAKNSVIPLGGRAKALSKKLKAPMMVYIDYDESVRTADGQAVDFAAELIMQALLHTSANSGPPDRAEATVAIIDGDNDKVAWTNIGGSAGGGMFASMAESDEEQSLGHIRNSLDWSLRELPKKEDLFKTDKTEETSK